MYNICFRRNLEGFQKYLTLLKYRSPLTEESYCQAPAGLVWFLHTKVMDVLERDGHIAKLIFQTKSKRIGFPRGKCNNCCKFNICILNISLVLLPFVTPAVQQTKQIFKQNKKQTKLQNLIAVTWKQPDFQRFQMGESQFFQSCIIRLSRGQFSV